MCRHIYDWNIVNCDVKQQIQLNPTQLKDFVKHFKCYIYMSYIILLSNATDQEDCVLLYIAFYQQPNTLIETIKMLYD